MLGKSAANIEFIFSLMEHSSCSIHEKLNAIERIWNNATERLISDTNINDVYNLLSVNKNVLFHSQHNYIKLTHLWQVLASAICPIL